MHRGYIKVYRMLQESEVWLGEPFTRGQAWLDVLMLTNRKDGVKFVRGNKVIIKRGQLGWSQEALAERWRWSRGKVLRFFSYLESVQQVIQHKSRLSTVYTIVNYEKYQGNDTTDSTTDGTTDSTTDGQQTDIRRTSDGLRTRIGNKGENSKKESNTPPTPSRSKIFVPPSVDEVAEYCRERGNRVDPQKFVDHYESKGWMVGRNKMKDWKAAIRANWEKDRDGGLFPNFKSQDDDWMKGAR